LLLNIAAETDSSNRPQVASHCLLKEKEYFGLAVVDDNGQYTW
jgi:hypothetical protein